MKIILSGVFLCCLLLTVPMMTLARGLVPCGGPDETPCQTCHVVDLTNNVIAWLVAILGVVAAIVIVYAGVKLVTSGGNQSTMESAKGLMSNIIIGYIIVLAGWLIIDFGMKALVDQGGFGVWNSIECVAQPVVNNFVAYSAPAIALAGVTGWAGAPVAGNMQATCDRVPAGPMGTMVNNCSAQIDQCRDVTGSYSVNAAGDTVTCVPSQGGTVDTGGLGQCSTGNSACSVAALQSAGLSSLQANIMSCIAMTESSGIASTPPYNITNPGSNSSACGTFQVVRTTWNGTATGACSDFSNCQSARCNLQVAVTLVRQSGYSSWTCQDCNENAPRCIARYGG